VVNLHPVYPIVPLVGFVYVDRPPISMQTRVTEYNDRETIRSQANGNDAREDACRRSARISCATLCHS